MAFKGKFKEKTLDLIKKYILFSTYDELVVVLLIKHNLSKKEVDSELKKLKIGSVPEDVFVLLKKAIQIEYLEYGSGQFDTIKVSHLKLLLLKKEASNDEQDNIVNATIKKHKEIFRL